MPNKNQKDKRIKLQIEFAHGGVARLEEIAKKGGHETKAGTIRDALRLYDLYLDQKKQGYKLQLAKPKDKYVREVDLVF